MIMTNVTLTTAGGAKLTLTITYMYTTYTCLYTSLSRTADFTSYSSTMNVQLCIHVHVCTQLINVYIVSYCTCIMCVDVGK